MSFSRDEVEAAFRHYFMVGPVLEDWVAWSQLFTEDAVYTDHFWGTFDGPAEIQRWIEGTMVTAPHVYTVLDWYVVDDGRVVYRALNRADNPVPGGPAFDFPSFQIVTYAGNGRWKAEEDIWLPFESKAWADQYLAACAEHDPDHPASRSRLDWGTVAWARPEPGHEGRPSWLGRDDIRPLRSRRDVDFGRFHKASI
jgi:ketosteroid isomerase-like protein